MKSLKLACFIIISSALILIVAVAIDNGGVLPVYKISVIVYPVYKEYKAGQIVNELTNSGCSKIEDNKNIILYCDKIDQRTVRAVHCSVNNGLKRILDDLNCEVPGKVNIAMLSGDELVKTVLDGYDVGLCQGAYYHGMILVLDPPESVKCNSNFVEEFSSKGPVIHELTHYVIDYKTNGNKPTWFSEGVALTEELKINKTLGMFDKQFTDYYSAKELQDNFYELEQIKAYRQSFEIVNYIINNFGMESVPNIMTELGKGNTMEQAVKKTLGMGLKELFRSSVNAT